MVEMSFAMTSFPREHFGGGGGGCFSGGCCFSRILTLLGVLHLQFP